MHEVLTGRTEGTRAARRRCVIGADKAGPRGGSQRLQALQAVCHDSVSLI